MAVFHKNRFVDSTLEMDGNEYIGCIFDRCTLVYRGGSSIRLVNNTFVDSEFLFDGPAANTLNLLHTFIGQGGHLREVVLSALGVSKIQVINAERPREPAPSGLDMP